MNDIDFSKIYSFSRISLFDKCRKQYYFYYLDPEIAPRKKEFIKPRDYKTKGGAIHNAITLFYHLPLEERTFKKLRNFLFDSWFCENEPSKAPPLGEIGGFKDIEHERKTYRKSLALLCNFFKFKDIDPPIFYLPTKNIRYSFSDYKSMIKPIDPIQGLSISGKFDRIDKLDSGNLRIIDFKTGKNASDSFQLEFYAYLAYLNFSKNVDLVSFYDLEGKKIINFDFSNIQLDAVKNKIMDKINAIENTPQGNFYPNPSVLCSHCDFKEICPVFKKNVQN